MRASNVTFLPVLLSTQDHAQCDRYVLDGYLDDVAVAYTVGPPYGERLVTWADLEHEKLSQESLRHAALENLDGMLADVRVHGQPPTLMLDFNGFESSLLLVAKFWDKLSESVPGDLVVGVPARDVMIITGSQSPPGLAKALRAVDRVFFAKGPNLLLQDLLVWRDGRWHVY